MTLFQSHSFAKHEKGFVYRLLIRLLRETRGQNLAEYALLLVLIALAATASIQELACHVNCAYEVAGKALAKGKNPPGQSVSCNKKC